MANHEMQTGSPSQRSEPVASFPTYERAQRIEQVTGRRGYGTAAMEGAASGAFTGALLGFILGLFSLDAERFDIVAAAWVAERAQRDLAGFDSRLAA